MFLSVPIPIGWLVQAMRYSWMRKKGSSAFIYQGSQSSQHQKNNLLQAIFFAWLAEGRTGPMVIKGVAA